MKSLPIVLELLGMEKGDYHYISPNSHVNMAQSTNDAFPTAIHIATLNALEGLLQTMGYMHDVFELKAEQFDHVLKWVVHTRCCNPFGQNLKRTLVCLNVI